jgi:hypothetical protein
MSRQDFNSKFRADMISNTGFVVCICGNKVDESSGNTVIADGVLEEFEIAEKLKKHPIPIGASGDTARRIREEVTKNLGCY